VKPLAMAGVMGGEHSGINDSTCDLFLESAFFPPAAIAGKARASFSSDASHRYEPASIRIAAQGMERATQLIVDICGGQPGRWSRRFPPSICLRASRCAYARHVPPGYWGFASTRSHRCDSQRARLAVERQGDDFLVTRHPSVSTSKSKKT